MTEMYTFDNTLVEFNEELQVVSVTLPDQTFADFVSTKRKWEATKERVALHGYLASCLDMPYSPYLWHKAHNEGEEPKAVVKYEEKAVKALGSYINLAKLHDWVRVDNGEETDYNTESTEEE